ncbi:MAG: hypothetical protein IJ583_16945 [Firmicutes bacterium]|nr:hypothetical protein [Bacillota bacterium]
MGLFGKKTKKKEPKPNLEKQIVKNIANGRNTESAIITYILLQADQNNIYLGKKEDVTYISFKNQRITDFLNEWYNILKMRQKNGITDKMYRYFVEKELLENKITADDTTSDEAANTEENEDMIDTIL